MIEAEPLRRVGALAIVRWRDMDMPRGLEALIEEARASGVEWIADFPGEWRARPFLGDGEALILALDGAKPAAMAVISADPHVPGPDVGRLRYIYVARAARGLGLLRVLVEVCLAHGSSRWRRIRLHTDNPQAARIYEHYGFAPASNEVASTHVHSV